MLYKFNFLKHVICVNFNLNILDHVLFHNKSHAVTQICHFLSLFQKLFLPYKNTYNFFYLELFVKLFDVNLN